jgi:hypothetical protein
MVNIEAGLHSYCIQSKDGKGEIVPLHTMKTY